MENGLAKNRKVQKQIADKKKRRANRAKKILTSDGLPPLTKVLFKPITDEKKHSETFKKIQVRALEPAARMMEQKYKSYDDKDGNFIEQFQTTGTDARIWELYLHSFFKEEDFSFDTSHDRPDFLLTKNNDTICVEATTTSKSTSGVLANIDLSIAEASPDFEAIKVGSAIWSKHNKEYWKLPHVKDHPLIFAIECFHQQTLFFKGDSALITYLYGKSFSWLFDANNQLQVRNHNKKKHVLDKKEIPSGYFNLPDTENVSAILFSNAATASKFNRIGKQKWGYDKLEMRRIGVKYDPNPNSTTPTPFDHQVNINAPHESWGQGAILFHNPNALHPVNPSLFPNIPHGFFKNGNFVIEKMPKFHPLQSVTSITVRN